MKTLKFCSVILILMLNVSCKKEIDYALVINTLRLGTWKVTYFVQDHADETSVFNGIAFVFNEDGTATAQNGTTVTSGTWQVSNGNLVTKLTLHFDNVTPVDRLNHDWHVEEVSGSIVDTKMIGGSGSLTLARN
jgi:hypothetical protein